MDPKHLIPFVTIGVLWGAPKVLDMEDPSTLKALVKGFLLETTLLLLLLGFVRARAMASTDETPVRIPVQTNPITGAETAPARTISAAAYDREQVWEAGKRLILSAGISLFLNVQYEIIRPIMLQCVLNPLHLFTSPLLGVYVYGRKGVERPWADGHNMMGDLRKAYNDAQAANAQLLGSAGKGSGSGSASAGKGKGKGGKKGKKGRKQS